MLEKMDDFLESGNFGLGLKRIAFIWAIVNGIFTLIGAIVIPRLAFFDAIIFDLELSQVAGRWLGFFLIFIIGFFNIILIQSILICIGQIAESNDNILVKQKMMDEKLDKMVRNSKGEVSKANNQSKENPKKIEQLNPSNKGCQYCNSVGVTKHYVVQFYQTLKHMKLCKNCAKKLNATLVSEEPVKIEVADDGTPLGTCELCNKDNVPTTYCKIVDESGTSYRIICKDCQAKYNATPTDP